MPGRRFAQRLTGLTETVLNRMAWAPSYRAPTAREVLSPLMTVTLPADVTAALAMCGARDVVWHEGVPVAASLSGRAFVSLGEQLFRIAPLRDVRLVAVDPVGSELPGCETLAQLERLSLAGCQLGKDVIPLVQSPHLAGLKELDLTRNDISDVEAAALAESPHLGSVRVLTVADNPRLTDVGWRLLRERFGRIHG